MISIKNGIGSKMGELKKIRKASTYLINKKIKVRDFEVLYIEIISIKNCVFLWYWFQFW